MRPLGHLIKGHGRRRGGEFIKMLLGPRVNLMNVYKMME